MAAPSCPGNAGWFGHPIALGGPARHGLERRQTLASTGPAQRSLQPRDLAGTPGTQDSPGQELRAGREWHCRCEAFLIHVSNYFFPDSPQHFIEQLGR